MAYRVYTSHRFDKSLVKMKKRGLPITAFQEVVRLLMTDGGFHQSIAPISCLVNILNVGNAILLPIGS